MRQGVPSHHLETLREPDVSITTTPRGKFISLVLDYSLKTLW